MLSLKPGDVGSSKAGGVQSGGISGRIGFGIQVSYNRECVTVRFASCVVVYPLENAQGESNISRSSDCLGIETRLLGPLAHRDRASGRDESVSKSVESSAKTIHAYAGDRFCVRTNAEPGA